MEVVERFLQDRRRPAGAAKGREMSRRKKIVVAVLATTVIGIAAAGCGGSGASSAEDTEAELQGLMVEYVEYMIDGENGRACAMTTAPEDCAGAMVLAQGFLGEGGLEALLPKDWRDRIEDTPVKVIDADTAELAAGDFGEDEEGEPTRFVREDGDWLMVYEAGEGL